uniref:Calponin-homology (CH) domain-containing protein n=1 Tax=Macrostomum lignano TaxID=282301 RepID=A0A1I8IEV3_9PLAT
KISGTGNEWTVHTVGESECRAFAGWINRMLEGDTDLRHLLPLGEADLFDKLSDGLVLCKLVNCAVPNTVHERAINKAELVGGSGGAAAGYRRHENLVLAINSAESIGCCVVNIGAKDISERRQHIVLGLLWQIIRIGLVKDITLAQHRELAALLLPGETVEELRQLSPEDLLLRWVNHQLDRAGCAKRLRNFREDIEDCEAYAYLLPQVAPAQRRRDLIPAGQVLALPSSDRLERARLVLGNAAKLDAAVFVQPEDVAGASEAGRNREKLNLAFVANLFNHYPAMDSSVNGGNGTDGAFEELDNQESLEERTYRNWMNSLGVNPYVKDLYSDLRNGLILLSLLDIIRPGVAPWSKVCRQFAPAAGRRLFQWQANCNYVVDSARAAGLPMTNIGAEDIRDGDRKLTLALAFQLLRAYTLGLLARLRCGSDGGDSGERQQRIEEQQILEWANSRLHSAGKRRRLAGFKDPSIADGLVILDLLDAIKPRRINWAAAEAAVDPLDRARYILSAARMLGARIFTLPEHVVQVNKNMMMTLFACLMVLDLQLNQQQHGN